jgi:biotin carboxyl carrier protein
MKLIVTVGGRRLSVEWPDLPGAEPQVDGAGVPCDLVPVRPGLYSLVVDGRSYEVVLEWQAADPEADSAVPERVLVHVAGATLMLAVQDERRHALVASQGGRRQGAGAEHVAVMAPMPGRIVAVPVQPGSVVERGQTVVVLEAMKMESALAAPHPGRVTEVLVAPGQTVQQRQPLVRIEG